ncbi:MAG: hypothetical protein AAFY88_29445, partial [Acidobacteriota bacterium]
QFVWNGGAPRGLFGWQGISGEDSTSRQCTPTFRNAGGGFFPLSGDDACALDRGTPLPSTPARDYDGEARPVGALDIGADELSTVLFCDGFESGDTAEWSVTAP